MAAFLVSKTAWGSKQLVIFAYDDWMRDFCGGVFGADNIDQELYWLLICLHRYICDDALPRVHRPYLC